MASYPNKIAHRPSRRRAGRNQGPFPPFVTVTAAPSGSTVVLTFSLPVVIFGNIPLVVATRTFVSQVVNSPTQVTVTMSGAVTTLAWSLAGAAANIATYQGGVVAGAGGTFP